jgi:hypothetical protein
MPQTKSDLLVDAANGVREKLGDLFAVCDLAGPELEDRLRAEVEAEYRRAYGGRPVHPEDEPFFRMNAALQVGYRFGLLVACGVPQPVAIQSERAETETSRA